MDTTLLVQELGNEPFQDADQHSEHEAMDAADPADDEDAPEDVEDSEDSDMVMTMQLHAQITYSAFTLLLEALGSAFEELSGPSQQVIAQHVLHAADSWAPTEVCTMLRAIFMAMCPMCTHGPEALPSMKEREERWLRQWLKVILRHLPVPACHAPQHDHAPPEESLPMNDAYQIQTLSGSCEQSTQTEHMPDYTNTSSHTERLAAEVLVTVGSSCAQVSQRMPLSLCR